MTALVSPGVLKNHGKILRCRMAKTPSSKTIVYHERARGRGVVRESSIDHIVPRPSSIPHGRFTYAATATRRIKIDLRLSVQSQETEEEAAERRCDAFFAAS